MKDRSPRTFEDAAFRSGDGFQLAVSSRDKTTGRLRNLFSNIAPDEGEEEHEHCESEREALTGEESRKSKLTGISSYSRLMRAHTQWQMESSTVPNYPKTMHVFTLNQLHTQSNMSKSETSSPHLRAQQALLPSPDWAGLDRLKIDDAPIPPTTSPSHERAPPPAKHHGGGMRARSTTQPAARDFAVSRRVVCG
jgi:hypothetical protein